MTIEKLPAGSHGNIAMVVLRSSKKLGEKVDDYLKQVVDPTFGDSFIVPMEQIRFSNGEGKIKLQNSVRGKDIYILCDVGNYSCTYQMFGLTSYMGPDEHFQDIKRVISAIGGKANRITVIMPLLYASRQHKRKGRESLDCALALRELEHLGVDTIITFDTHDPTIQNAIPVISFENIYPTYTILKRFILQEKDVTISKDKLLVISPDTGAMDRAIFYAGVLGLDVGMFYKRRDHNHVVGGKNPIMQHEYLGSDVAGKDILIVDDMIASGESMIDIVVELKKRNARNIFIAVSFALFTEGVQRFDKLYEDGMLSGLYCTNLSYVPDEYKERPWFREADLSKFTSMLIYSLNHDISISPLLDAAGRIKKFMSEHQAEIQARINK